MDKITILKQYFGHSEFRRGQAQIIDSITAGRDALAVMPTGGGKSLCYQVPALLLPGITLVISPLISLMKDQVMALKSAGVDTAYINSSLSSEQLREVYRRMRGGAYRIVYIAPERLEGEGFVALMQELELSLIAVDEAHCISQWGQDFRPSYLKITEFLARLEHRPTVAAFTATATESVRRDIARILELRDPFSVVTGFDRPNLSFDVLRPHSKMSALRTLLATHGDKSGIIYCSTRKLVESVCEELNGAGLAATRYHAGLSPEERQENQDAFQYDKKTVMVATNAFGMGIDKSNVGYVIHYNMPKSVEAYYQEAGRAGRDGEKADCVLLYSAGDIKTARFLIENGGGNENLTDEERRSVMQQDFARLDEMIGYCRTADCQRGYILDYFGQEHEERCGNCGSCRGEYAVEDITTAAQMILSCVRRVRDKLGYSVGAATIIKVLRGAREKRLQELGLDTLSTYGLMSVVPQDRVREYIEFLEERGYVFTSPAHSTLELTAASQGILFRGETLEMRIKQRTEAEKKERAAAANTTLGDVPAELYNALRNLRTQLAEAEGVPAYIVFSNATLVDMAHRRPRSIESFLDVNGVGKLKATLYGKQFLAAIAQYEAMAETATEDGFSL